MQRTNRAGGLADIASALLKGNDREAKEIAGREFPWTATESRRRGIPPTRALRVFVRDRFIDRYSGSRLVFPGSLLAIGKLLREQFPMHPTWKAGQSHEIFWELWPAVDHIDPVARGGAHDESNFATTSTINNSAKGNARLDEIGWTLKPPPGPDETWDGLVPWFRQIAEIHPEVLSDSLVKGWNNALRKVAF
jgi:hypothetical protein